MTTENNTKLLNPPWRITDIHGKFILAQTHGIKEFLNSKGDINLQNDGKWEGEGPVKPLAKGANRKVEFNLSLERPNVLKLFLMMNTGTLSSAGKTIGLFNPCFL
jgi:hypothetical protein